MVVSVKMSAKIGAVVPVVFVMLVSYGIPHKAIVKLKVDVDDQFEIGILIGQYIMISGVNPLHVFWTINCVNADVQSLIHRFGQPSQIFG